jgi:hypothetical protein
MAAKIKTYPKPDDYEMGVLRKYFWLQDWHFKILKVQCIEIASYPVYWDRGKEEFEYAKVYGLMGIMPSTKERCVANFFIRYDIRLYQTNNFTHATEILYLLTKEHRYENYLEQLDILKCKSREKVVAKRNKIVKKA